MHALDGDLYPVWDVTLEHRPSGQTLRVRVPRALGPYAAGVLAAEGLGPDPMDWWPCAAEPAPMDMVLRCPECGMQHVDREAWEVRPHRTHLCEHCGHHWTPDPMRRTRGVVRTPGHFPPRKAGAKR